MALKVPCPQCGKVPPPDCDCPPLPPGPPDEPAPAPAASVLPVVSLRRERRRGRDTIVIEGFSSAAAAEYARLLKTKCASGGTVKGGRIEIQGDHRKTIEAFLQARGFKTKRTGG